MNLEAKKNTLDDKGKPCWEKVKQVELLEMGEITLGNRKIIGTCELNYIYKHKFRLLDKLEAVLVNKINLS